MAEHSEPVPLTGVLSTDFGVNRVADHVFTIFSGGGNIEMAQPACAYPGGATQVDIESIYSGASRSEWFRMDAPAAHQSLHSWVVAWQGLWFSDGSAQLECIENARASVVAEPAPADVTVHCTFGPALFAGTTAELPVQFHVSGPADGGDGGHETRESFVVTATGAWRAT